MIINNKLYSHQEIYIMTAQTQFNVMQRRAGEATA